MDALPDILKPDKSKLGNSELDKPESIDSERTVPKLYTTKLKYVEIALKLKVILSQIKRYFFFWRRAFCFKALT
jgi:hypothetical protein